MIKLDDILNYKRIQKMIRSFERREREGEKEREREREREIQRE